MATTAPGYGEPLFQVPQALLLTGDGLRAMQGERLQMLREMVGGLGLHITVVTDLESTGMRAEAEPEPIPVTKGDFRAFAEEHHYAEPIVVDRAWALATSPSDFFTKYGARLPVTRYLDGVVLETEYEEERLRDQRVIDLRSIYERFAASDGNILAWGGGRSDRGRPVPDIGIDFLAHLVNERVRPEEPITVKRFH